jgi:predicted RNase H-like nuclease (RuvC/YqgF family)
MWGHIVWLVAQVNPAAPSSNGAVIAVAFIGMLGIVGAPAIVALINSKAAKKTSEDNSKAIQRTDKAATATDRAVANMQGQTSAVVGHLPEMTGLLTRSLDELEKCREHRRTDFEERTRLAEERDAERAKVESLERQLRAKDSRDEALVQLLEYLHPEVPVRKILANEEDIPA